MFHSLIFFDIILHPGRGLVQESKCDTEWLLIKRCKKAEIGSSLCQRGFERMLLIQSFMSQDGWSTRISRFLFKKGEIYTAGVRSF